MTMRSMFTVTLDNGTTWEEVYVTADSPEEAQAIVEAEEGGEVVSVEVGVLAVISGFFPDPPPPPPF